MNNNLYIYNKYVIILLLYTFMILTKSDVAETHNSIPIKNNYNY